MRTKLIILDFDGTLGDTRHNIVKTLQATLSQKRLPVPGEEECAATIGIPLYDAFLRLAPHITTNEAQECVDLYRNIFEVNKKKLMPQLFPHVLETLNTLHKRGIILTIASSRSNISLHDFIHEMQLAKYITYTIGAEDVTHAKPHPEPVLKTLEAYGIAAKETLVVGDMPYDIIMGINAGTHTCGVTYGNATRQQLKDSNAEYIIDEFAELLNVIE